MPPLMGNVKDTRYVNFLFVFRMKIINLDKVTKKLKFKVHEIKNLTDIQETKCTASRESVDKCA